MPVKILKRLAVVVGAGIALGAATASRRRLKDAVRQDILSLEPLLDRFDRIEERVDQLPATLAASADLHAKNVADLRDRIAESEARAREATQRMEARFTEIRGEVPLLVEAGMSLRVEQLRLRLLEDLERHQENTLRNFEAELEAKVARSIAGIEAKLAEQSVVLASITTRSVETDQNLQRLIGAVQTLVDRAMPNSAGATAPAQAVIDESQDLKLPFQAHLDQAIQSAQEYKRKMPMAPLMMAAFMLGLRWIR